MSRTLRRVLPLAVFVSAVLWAGSAMAQPAEWKRVDVTLHSEQSGGVMVVTGELPEAATLPAEAELSVPAGSYLQWVGQILGGDPSADPDLTYVKSTASGSDVYRFTLTKSRIAQIEITSEPPGFDGTTYTSALKWSATQSVPEVRLSVQVPQGAKIVQTAPDAVLQPIGSDGSYYTKAVKDVKPGAQLDMTFSYQLTVTPTSGAASTSSGSAAQILIILLAIAAGAFVVVAVRRKMVLAPDENSTPARESAKNTASQPRTRARSKTNAQSGRSSAATSASATTAVVEETNGQARRLSGASKRKLMIAVIAGPIIVVALLVGNQTTKPQIEGDSITKTFSQGQPCSKATIALIVPAGADPARTAETLFAALRPVSGMNTATYNLKTSTLEAGFCESKATEDGVRQALAPTGLVDASASTQSAVPAPAESAAAAASGGGQSLTVDTSSGSFAPSRLTAKAGEVIEITFGQGSGCTAEVVFPQLNVRESLEGGPVKVKLPALEAGTYTFACGMDMQHGTLVVQ